MQKADAGPAFQHFTELIGVQLAVARIPRVATGTRARATTRRALVKDCGFLIIVNIFYPL